MTTPLDVDVPPSGVEHDADDSLTATREAWLLTAIDSLEPTFTRHGYTLPPVRVSVGFPGGRRPARGKTVGQCWSDQAAADGRSQIFVSPILEDVPEILAVLTHELIHAINFANGHQDAGHGPHFRRIALKVGLESPLTSSIAGPALAEEVATLTQALDPYPHSALNAGGSGADVPKKQDTRMMKVECAEGSGYLARISRKWLNEYGPPLCACHGTTMCQPGIEAQEVTPDHVLEPLDPPTPSPGPGLHA